MVKLDVLTNHFSSFSPILISTIDYEPVKKALAVNCEAWTRIHEKGIIDMAIQ